VSDFQSYIASLTIVCVCALLVVTRIALFAVGRAIPDRGFKDQ